MAAPTLLAVARGAAPHPTGAPTTARQALEFHPSRMGGWGPLSRGAAPAIAAALEAVPADRRKAVSNDPAILGAVAGRPPTAVDSLVGAAFQAASAAVGGRGYNRPEVWALACTLLREVGAATAEDLAEVTAAGEAWVADWEARKAAPPPAFTDEDRDEVMFKMAYGD